MKKALIIVAAALALASCAPKEQNPFMQEWDTPYGIPPFDKIKIEHYMPAIKAGIAEQEAEIKAIVDNPAAPTFENTVAALELSGNLLSKVTGVLYNLSETENSPEMEALIEEATPLQSQHSDNIYMNKKLYERVAAIYNADQSGLTREQQMVLKKLYEAFERNGIGLSDADQEELRKINTEMSTVSNKLSTNLLAENNAFKEEFGISVSAYPTAMTTTEDRALRERMFKAYSSRGHNGNEYDNRELFLKLMDLRTRKAKLMGYDNSADFLLANKMAHDHQTVDEFLDGIMKAAVIRAKEEVADMEKIAGFKIEPWDWWYYSEKVRQQKYALDEEMTKPYFEVNNVRKGVFLAAKTLYGVNVEELPDVPKYNPEVIVYKVTDENGNLLGIFSSDYFPRSSKRGGAWMNNFRDQYFDANGNEVRPIICNVANFTSPDENGVALLTVDEVETAFHEFGHALHGLLTKCHYPSVSGTSVTRDFVETFSQFNENWAFQPELLAQYAKHYQTGEVIPQELVDKIINSSKFNQGFATTELCAASILDMKWHELSSVEGIDIDEFEAKVCKEMGLIDEIIPRYRTSYFNHIFGGGYSAGYYGYLWAEVIDKDAFAAFEESPNGVWDKELAKKFKETFLEKGGSEEAMTLFKQFRGREPQSEPFLRGRGLL
ncbi:MAG: M3 family metallopeptidase [Bacteroidales bacterium]|nr:M3 family metallopeptidase [Bacteroidales bacterium]MBQ3984526.1 M3 family metallopeptidase [Bacteroidales bacterium]